MKVTVKYTVLDKLKTIKNVETHTGNKETITSALNYILSDQGDYGLKLTSLKLTGSNVTVVYNLDKSTLLKEVKRQTGKTETAQSALAYQLDDKSDYAIKFNTFTIG